MKLSLILFELVLAAFLAVLAVEGNPPLAIRVLAGGGCAFLVTLAFLIAADGRW